MLIYYFLLIFVIFGCLYSKNIKYRNILYGFLIVFIYIMLCGLRGLYCGTDNLNYLYEFNTNERTGTGLEYGYLLSLQVIPYFQLWEFSYAFATYIILFSQLKRETKYICLGLLIYLVSPTKFFAESFNIVRQSLAASLTLWALINWHHNKKLETFLSIILATLFHSSSIIIVPFLFLKYLRIPYWLGVIALLSTLIIGYLNKANDMLQLFTYGIEQYSFSDATYQIAHKYSGYGENSYSFNINGIIANTFPLTCLAIITYPFSDRAKLKYGYYYNVFVFATLLGNVFIPAIQFGFRLVFSLQIVQVIVIPLAFEYSRKLRQKFLILLITGISLIYIYYIYHLPDTGNINSIVPYKFFDDIQFVIDSFHV